jgi:LAGLIDADG DNA endonuclease family protein
VSSENPSGADNQQETESSSLALDARWIVGFVDGEGCFSVSVHRNGNAKSTGGWQLHPVFHVYQHQQHRAVLEALVRFFGCGRIRAKGPGSAVLTFAVDGLTALEEHIVPFFEAHPLVVKHDDFFRFALIVRSMRRREHLTAKGFEQNVRLAYAMNAAGKQRARSIDEILLGSSETARQARSNAVKIQSDPHGDMRSQAEMT